VSEDRQLLLDKLRVELAFIERGGYRNPVRGHWRPQFVFEDSAMCLNRDPTQKFVPCGECVLARFVPNEWARKRAPCRHIPLNEGSETIDALYRAGTQDELEAAVTDWLKKTVRKIEKEIAES
jgi:hypothetical protein